MVPMSIDKKPHILAQEIKIDLNYFEINQIKKFVKNNKDLLLQLAEANIDFFDFLEKMILMKV
ncbi:hypothetical protein LQZ19_00515 [Treponema primitia]|uniref:hypothetical protein n=1 Tax=Treponema primitia TaxID=88058 RepID=UPI00397EA4DB